MRAGTPVVLFKLFALAVFAIGAADGQVKENQKVPPNQVDETEGEAIDLRSKLKDQELLEGLNLIHADQSGIRLSVRVKRGEIVEWVAKDAKGKKLPTSMSKRHSSLGHSWCMATVTFRDENGNLQKVRFNIPCTWVIKKPQPK